MRTTTVGYGDEASWPSFDGHPHDPRANFEQEEQENELLAETDELLLWLRQFGSTDDHCNLFDMFAADSIDDILRARNALRAKYIAWRLR